MREKKIKMTKEDQEAFAKAIINPHEVSPALVKALRKRAEILNKVADGTEGLLEGRVVPHDVAMERITESLCDPSPRTTIRTDEDLRNLAMEMGIDPDSIDD